MVQVVRVPGFVGHETAKESVMERRSGLGSIGGLSYGRRYRACFFCIDQIEINGIRAVCANDNNVAFPSVLSSYFICALLILANVSV